jgi:3-oxoacyl-[acyl-carrier protein] reductase
MSFMVGLNNRVAVVTGGSGGIGRGIALELARRGCQVVVNYNANADAAQGIVNEIETSGGEAVAVRANVTAVVDVEALMKAAVDTFGRIDILVNNAGIARPGLIMMTKEENWDAVVDTNLKSAWLCSKAAVKPMMRARYGRIMNVGSTSGLMGMPGDAHYSASKAGMIGLTKALAREVASRHITVNLVAPGAISAGMSEQATPEMVEEANRRIPLGRWGTDQEVAQAVAFLASDEAGYITGHVLVVDGGLSM